MVRIGAAHDLPPFFGASLVRARPDLPCGWLKDKFGLSWQVVPSVLGEMLQYENRERANRVMQAMLQMTKIDIAKLRHAYEQG